MTSHKLRKLFVYTWESNPQDLFGRLIINQVRLPFTPVCKLSKSGCEVNTSIFINLLHNRLDFFLSTILVLYVKKTFRASHESCLFYTRESNP